MPERIPPPPPTQALNTTTFTPPPLDLSLTLAELIDFHRTHSPNHVVYVYEDAPGERKRITFSTWIRAIHRAGRHVRNLFQLPEPQVDSAKPVISMLANSGEKYIVISSHFPTLIHASTLDTITYATVKLGIVRIEGVPFAVSPRNSAPGVAHLVEKTGSKYIIVTPDLKLLADAAVSILKERGSEIPVIQLMPAFKDLFPNYDPEDFEYLPELKLKGSDDPAVILHSSGGSRYLDLRSVWMVTIVFPQGPSRSQNRSLLRIAFSSVAHVYHGTAAVICVVPLSVRMRCRCSTVWD